MALIFESASAATAFGLTFLAYVLLDARLVTRALTGRDAAATRGMGHRPAGILWIIGGETVGLALAVVDATVLQWRWPLLVVGLVIAWAGIALRFWAKRVLGRFFVGAVVVQEAHHVVSDGPYAVIRHPGYAGAILALLGFGIATGNVLTVAVFFAVPIFVFLRTIGVEEATLVGALDEYAAYQRRTARLVPGVW